MMIYLYSRRRKHYSVQKDLELSRTPIVFICASNITTFVRKLIAKILSSENYQNLMLIIGRRYTVKENQVDIFFLWNHKQ
jgi:hypothetical protein